MVSYSSIIELRRYDGEVTPSRPPRPLDDARASVDAVRAITRVARALERASTEIPMAHYRILSAVAAGEDRASRLAERLALGRPAISAAVDALCRDGYLVRGDVADDQRAVDLRLSERGADVLDRVEHAMVRVLDELVRGAPEGEHLVASLAAFNVTLDGAFRRRRGSGGSDA